MKGTPALTEQSQLAEPATQWSAGLGTSLRSADILHKAKRSNVPWEVRRTSCCVWIIVTVSSNVKLGLRSVFCPTGLSDIKVSRADDEEINFRAHGGLGKYQVHASFLEGESPMLHLVATLEPREPVRISAAPRELCVLDGRLNPYHGKGRLFTCQTGNTAGQAFFSALEGKGGTAFYFQNLTGLSDYFQDSGARVTECVAGEWPEAGFSLPEGDAPLKPGKKYRIADCYVEIASGVVNEEVDAALMFLNGLARIYPKLSQPAAEFYDWPEASKKTLKNLNTSPGCTRKVDGKLFVEAYVGSSYKPPESMVQGALIVPLLEYASWQDRGVPLLDKLNHVPASFFDAKLAVPVRWLPGGKFTKAEPSEEEKRFRMDSWYLLHTIMNLGRMGELGWQNARKVFFDSLPSLIRTAQHFEYDWPVFFDQRNLKVHKHETGPGEGGEQDAGGLYIHIMMQAYILTHKQHYLDEAETAADKLTNLSFGVLYQTNNTVIGAVALARLWRATGKIQYKNLSFISLASTFSHLWLWYLGRETLTFLGLPPLHDAPYLAFYEEAEILAAMQTYQEEMRDDLPASLGLLLAEYQKHLLARGRFYYPPELPDALHTSEPKEGVMKPWLWIPLEGLGVPAEKAGTVGQAVYAAAAPFILTARCWHRRKGVPFTVFCSYPIFDVEFSGGKEAGCFSFRIGGSPDLSCLLRILPTTGIEVALTVESKRQKMQRTNGDRDLSAELAGGCPVMLTWKRMKRK